MNFGRHQMQETAAHVQAHRSVLLLTCMIDMTCIPPLNLLHGGVHPAIAAMIPFKSGLSF